MSRMGAVVLLVFFFVVRVVDRNSGFGEFKRDSPNNNSMPDQPSDLSRYRQTCSLVPGDNNPEAADRREQAGEDMGLVHQGKDPVAAAGCSIPSEEGPAGSSPETDPAVDRGPAVVADRGPAGSRHMKVEGRRGEGRTKEVGLA